MATRCVAFTSLIGVGKMVIGQLRFTVDTCRHVLGE